MSAPEQRLLIEFPGADRAPAELPRQGKLVLGSSAQRADVRLEGEGVEAVHCAIRPLKKGGWALVDMGAEIGTRVNGRIVDKVRLRHGDRIRIGTEELLVVDPSRALEGAGEDDPGSGAAGSGVDRNTADSAERPNARVGTGGADTRARGMRIGGYRIERILGRGGMGQVYLALQERLDREVALKILPSRLAQDGDFVRQFEAEARAAAALNHPNVVTVFDVGEEGGRHYLSMEYMHGGCLETRLAEEGPLPWKVVLDVLHDAASGLVYAESRGIVHRDIKPSNLMQNAEGTTKIADLGLAKGVDEAGDTEEGQPLRGTPHFIAPELIHGEPPDSRSDLYSLGATAYRLLTGETPFEGQSPREILRNVLGERPRPIQSLAPEAPAPLRATIERLLSREPTERHPSAAILLRELDQIRGGSPITPMGELMGAGTGRRRVPVLPVLGGLASLAVLVAGAWFATRPSGEGDGPREPLRTEASGVEGDTLPGGDAADTPEDRAAASDPEGGATDAFQGLVFAEEEPEGPAVGGDADMAARLLEAEAQVEYLKLGELVLTPEEREARLQALAQRYKGTDSAFRALEEIAEEREARAAEQARSEADDELTRKAGAALQAAAEGIEDHRVRTALEAVRAVEAPSGLANGARFRELRAAAEATILERGLAHGKKVVEEANGLAERGDFDAVERLLTDFAGRLELPERVEGEEPSPLAAELEQLATDAFARVGGLSAERAAWLSSESARDRRRVADRMRAGDGVAARLASFDFAGGAEKAQAARAAVLTPAARDRLERLHGELDGARAALQSLGMAWDAGDWRRKSIAAPEGFESRVYDAVGADAEGVFVDDGGDRRHLAWREWATSPRELHVLFHERLERPWTPAELRGIAALFRLGAVAEGARRARVLLEGAEPPQVGSGLAGDYLELAGPWAELAGSTAELEAERAAMELLQRALEARATDAPTLAVALMERLLAEHRETLFVLLLSDGGNWEHPESGTSGGGPAPMDAPK